MPTLPEVEKLRDKKIKVLCVMGEDERDSLCRALREDAAQVIRIKGGHHFGGDYEAIAAVILKEIQHDN